MLKTVKHKTYTGIIYPYTILYNISPDRISTYFTWRFWDGSPHRTPDPTRAPRRGRSLQADSRTKACRRSVAPRGVARGVRCRRWGGNSGVWRLRSWMSLEGARVTCFTWKEWSLGANLVVSILENGLPGADLFHFHDFRECTWHRTQQDTCGSRRQDGRMAGWLSGNRRLSTP